MELFLLSQFWRWKVQTWRENIINDQSLCPWVHDLGPTVLQWDSCIESRVILKVRWGLKSESLLLQASNWNVMFFNYRCRSQCTETLAQACDLVTSWITDIITSNCNCSRWFKSYLCSSVLRKWSLHLDREHSRLIAHISPCHKCGF